MNRDDYKQCLEDLENIFYHDIDQIYSDYVNIILLWRDSEVIDLEYLLDPCITADNASQLIMQELKTKPLHKLGWITKLDFDREYFVVEDFDALRNLVMEDIDNLKASILKQLELNIDDKEDTPREAFIKKVLRIDFDKAGTDTLFLKLITMAKEYEAETGDTSLHEYISQFCIEDGKEGDGVRRYIKEQIDAGIPWPDIRYQLMNLDQYRTVFIKSCSGMLMDPCKVDLYDLRKTIVRILREKAE